MSVGVVSGVHSSILPDIALESLNNKMMIIINIMRIWMMILTQVVPHML